MKRRIASDAEGMRVAIEAAKRGTLCGMRAFGSVIVDPDGVVLAEAAGSETECDPTRHSEILAIRNACRARNGLLQDCTLYQTLEPCIGCAGFLNHSKIGRVVIGALRRDLPELFRARHLDVRQLLADTSHPPAVVVLEGAQRLQCIALFDRERNILAA